MPKKMWGGRFTKEIDPLAEEFAKSIQFDYKLAWWDLMGSRFHVWVLEKSGYLTGTEAGKLMNALLSITGSIKNGTFKPDPNAEDIHSQIQDMLQQKVGDLVLKLQTARSRNDQVLFATKFYCKVNIQSVEKEIKSLIQAFSLLAKKNSQTIIPGFTHMQHAQPVLLKDYLMAYVEMLKRDLLRLGNVFENIQITLGSGALAGTPIEASEYKLKTSQVLKEHQEYAKMFNISPTANSLDTVSDRDFVIETIAALSLIATHLSRLAEDLIIWSTKEFDFIEIDEAFCTGSSLMPQKKNPDVLELIRGYAGRLYGNLVSVLTMMKGLPLTYNRDMQLDKEPLFNSFEIMISELKVLTGLISSLQFNQKKIREHLKDESLYATDIVYYLVHKKVPFKEAHTIVGELIKYSLENNISIQSMSEAQLKKFSDCLDKADIESLFDPEVSVRSKRSIQRGRK